MKFGQLMKYKMRHIFLEKLYTKYENMVETLFPNPFPKKSKLSISLQQQSSLLYNLYLLHLKFRTIEQNILKISCKPFAFTSCKAFLKKREKEDWNQPPCLIFCMIFEEKCQPRCILLTGRFSLSGYLYFVILGNIG